MHMTMTLAALLGAAWLATGCAATEGARRSAAPRGRGFGTSQPAPAAIGRPVRDVIAAAQGRRVNYFDTTGRQRDGLRAGEPGSVSIYTWEGDGQDNYAFDAEGKVVRQQHSHGENYVQGVWTEVK